MAEMCIMDRTGDTKLIFDPNRPDEVEAAQEMFKKMKKKGYLAYRVTDSGGNGEVMHEFDAKAGKIVMAPPMVGG